MASIKSRTDRTVYTFLFKNLLLMTKKDDDGYQYKTHIEVRPILYSEPCTPFEILVVGHNESSDTLIKKHVFIPDLVCGGTFDPPAHNDITSVKSGVKNDYIIIVKKIFCNTLHRRIKGTTST